jgi:hypothetical protein
MTSMAGSVIISVINQRKRKNEVSMTKIANDNINGIENKSIIIIICGNNGVMTWRMK